MTEPQKPTIEQLESILNSKVSVPIEILPNGQVRAKVVKPTVARIVHYKLTAQDAEQINRRRTSGGSIADRLKTEKWPRGAQAHIGNGVSVGQVVPLIVTAVWPEEYASNVRLAHHPEGTKYESPFGVNGQVLLDGNDSFWVTSAPQHPALDGCWSWPRIVAALMFAAVAAILFAPAVALAQETAGPALAGPGWLAPVLQYVVAPMIPILGAALLALLTQGVLYLRSRAKDSKTMRVLSQVGDVALTVAAKVEAVERPLMQSALADGKLTPAEGKQLADSALTQLKGSLSTDVLKALPGVVGSGVDAYLGAKLEQANAAQPVQPSPT